MHFSSLSSEGAVLKIVRGFPQSLLANVGTGVILRYRSPIFCGACPSLLQLIYQSVLYKAAASTKGLCCLFSSIYLRNNAFQLNIL
jgi:hypothetical protein